ncbi:MAG: NAD(P)-dependent alcohol dehydrogenase, partial [Chloroflexi bacterium]|nr:NAD(P)-dependent alcohol dehydrogenase [Chloroflexota bacterium]
LFKAGDQVFGAAGWGSGAYAEYKCVGQDARLALKPDNMNYEESAAVAFGAGTALHFIRKANIDPEQKVLIYGASGSVGSYAVQIAKYYGAEVTGVCSTANLELVQSLGADNVIDYTAEDFTKNGVTYDVIFDAVYKTFYSACKNSLAQAGVYATVGMSMVLMMQMLWTKMASSRRIISGVASIKAEDILLLKELAQEGHLKSVIDKTYPLEQIAEAHAYVEAGHKVGNVVITI